MCYTFAIMSEPRLITVATDLSNPPSYDFLAGVLRYVHAHPNWRLQILQSPQELTANIVRRIDATPGAGLITTELHSPEVTCALEHATHPLVLVGTRDRAIPKRTANIVLLSIDETSVGHQASEHLLTFGGFCSCAFLPSLLPSAAVLSGLREKAFRSVFSKRGIPVLSFRGVPDAQIPGLLAEMPRPVAVLAESAERGNSLLQAAEATNLIIPRHCALLAIERNTLLCAATRPRLSHAYPSATDEGYKAAALLEDLMSRKKTRRRQIILETPLVFNDAESTTFVSPAAALIKNASEIINTDFTLLADAEAVAARLGVSRRLLDLRFREYTGKTVAEILRAKKLNAFAAKLAESKESISSLAESCGFPNTSYLKTLFKRSYGVSPGVYRQSAAIGEAGAASIRR